MSEIENFSDFSRQSKLGICIIYFNNTSKFLKSSWIFLLLVFKDISTFSVQKKNLLLFALVLIFISLIVHSYLVFKNFKFKITDKKFVLQQGVLNKSSMSISLNRIQNINLKQNILHQLLNIYEFQLETAGSDTTEISIRALKKNDAEKLKKLIYEQKEKTIKQNTDTEKSLHLTISLKDLLKVGLSNNHVKSFIVVFLLFLGFYKELEDVLSFLGITYFQDVFNNSIKAVFLDFSSIIFSLLLMVFISFVYSLVVVVIKHYNFSLEILANSFQIRQGLFTKQNVILKLSKIQYFTISSNPIKRLFGFSFLTFKQTDNSKSQKNNLAKLIRIVGITNSKLNILTKHLEAYYDTSELTKEKPHKYYLLRMLWQCFIFLILLFVFLTFFLSLNEVMIITVFLAVILFLLVNTKYKKRFFYFTKDRIILCSGIYSTNKTFIETFKIQNVALKQSVFQKRRNLVDLVLQSAYDELTIPCLQEDRASQLYNYILFKIETENKPWM